MKQVEETNKSFKVNDGARETGTPIGNGGASTENSGTKRRSLAWIPVLALIVSAGIILIII